MTASTDISSVKPGLCDLVREMLSQLTPPDAPSVDTANWLERWLDQELPALGGRKASEFMGSVDGLIVLKRLLGAMQSGAYQ